MHNQITKVNSKPNIQTDLPDSGPNLDSKWQLEIQSKRKINQIKADHKLTWPNMDLDSQNDLNWFDPLWSQLDYGR